MPASLLEFTDPSTLTPLFTAQQTICAYQISDFYAQPPRYLYYSLLLATFVTQWTGWLANVFLGAAAAYAGIAAIEAFILRSRLPAVWAPETVTIPLVSSPLNATFTNLQALVTDRTEIMIQPSALELDIDPILAIVVIGCLVALPVQCWSHVVRANRARQLVITLWNALMLAGAICALSLWPKSLSLPDQYKFCYPAYPDPNTINRDEWPAFAWAEGWNSTVWNLFSNFALSEQLSDNCFYPCFNTTQILRKPTSLTASDYSTSSSPRLSMNDLEGQSTIFFVLPTLVYVAISLSVAVTVCLLFISHLQLSRVSATEPKLLWRSRRELGQTLSTEFVTGTVMVYRALRGPRTQLRVLRSMEASSLFSILVKILRFVMDITTVLLLFIAMVLSPMAIIVFLIWIEYYIHGDGFNGESPQQVGQWSTYGSVILVLLSALVYRLKYVIASRQDIEEEIRQTRLQLHELESLLHRKEKV